MCYVSVCVLCECVCVCVCVLCVMCVCVCVSIKTSPNSAPPLPTLESKHLPGQPPLEFALGQAVQCLKHMSRNGLGSAAFTGVQDIVSS